LKTAVLAVEDGGAGGGGVILKFDFFFKNIMKRAADIDFVPGTPPRVKRAKTLDDLTESKVFTQSVFTDVALVSKENCAVHTSRYLLSRVSDVFSNMCASSDQFIQINHSKESIEALLTIIDPAFADRQTITTLTISKIWFMCFKYSVRWKECVNIFETKMIYDTTNIKLLGRILNIDALRIMSEKILNGHKIKPSIICTPEFAAFPQWAKKLIAANFSLKIRTRF
jgi:hypothetical protein